MKAAFFCHNGLGDGINGLVLSRCLKANGWAIDTYQNTLGSMQNWFPDLPVKPYPDAGEVPRILESYEWFFVVQNDTSPFVLRLIREGKQKFPERIKVIYLYPSKRIVREPYYADCLTDPSRPVAENMALFCERILGLPKRERGVGFAIPVGLEHRKNRRRVVIHPTSGKASKNWSREKFCRLALHLKKMGYHPVFVLGSPQEREEWGELGFEAVSFATVDALARYLYESGYLIGNDSGLGHLASALHVPTVTLCRRETLAKLWRPSFGPGAVVAAPNWVPNIRGFRLRDKHWQFFVSVGRVLRAFRRLASI